MARPIQHPELDTIDLPSVLQALSDPVRLSIVRMAAGQEGLPCGEFQARIPKSTMSHHWRVLRGAGVIRQEGEGTRRRNYLRRDELDRRFPGLLAAVLAASE